MRLIDAEDLIDSINTAEENFKFDHMETIGGDEEASFVDGVLSGVFCIREIIKQEPTIKETYTKDEIITMFEELKEELREIHEDYFETEHFDEAYGVSTAMDKIQEKIKTLKEGK